MAHVTRLLARGVARRALAWLVIGALLGACTSARATLENERMLRQFSRVGNEDSGELLMFSKRYAAAEQTTPIAVKLLFGTVVVMGSLVLIVGAGCAVSGCFGSR